MPPWGPQPSQVTVSSPAKVHDVASSSAKCMMCTSVKVRRALFNTTLSDALDLGVGGGIGVRKGGGEAGLKHLKWWVRLLSEQRAGFSHDNCCQQYLAVYQQ